MDVKTAIRNGDADALQQLLREDSWRANALVHWGKCRTHPLHYVSDMLFEGTLQRGKELPLVEALIQAGADLDFQRNAKPETPLAPGVCKPTPKATARIAHDSCRSRRDLVTLEIGNRRK